MGFVALVITLLLEQFRPLPARGVIGSAVETVADATERNMNAGKPEHGIYAWLALVGGATLLAGLVYAAALWVSWITALLINVLVLYATLGFRQFSHHFTEIQNAIAVGDIATARRELGLWKRQEFPDFDAADLDAEEVIRQSLEYGLLLAQRHVFGVFFWFVLLPGPMGPVMYRLADYVARYWNRPPPSNVVPRDRFGRFARRAFAWIDAVPVRFAATGFAIVGDFEGAVYCWRCVARTALRVPGWPHPDSRTLLLAAASGALGTRLMSAQEAARLFDEPGLEGAGLAQPQARTLQSGAAMMWRAVVLWLILLLLLSLSGRLTFA